MSLCKSLHVGVVAPRARLLAGGLERWDIEAVGQDQQVDDAALGDLALAGVAEAQQALQQVLCVDELITCPVPRQAWSGLHCLLRQYNARDRSMAMMQGAQDRSPAGLPPSPAPPASLRGGRRRQARARERTQSVSQVGDRLVVDRGARHNQAQARGSPLLKSVSK